MQERIIDRLTKWMSEHGINDNQLTNMADLSVGLLGNSRKEGRDIGKKATEKILSVLPDIDRNWLLTGTTAFKIPEGMILVNKEEYDSLCEIRKHLKSIISLLTSHDTENLRSGGSPHPV